VSPSGRIGCGAGDSAYVVDGGYFDNSGVSPLVELWAALEPLVARADSRPGAACVVPFLVEIDNSYAQPPGPGRAARPHELLVPAEALSTTHSAREDDARIAAAIEFSGEIAPGLRAVTDAGVRVAYLFPRAHPGTEAPLGWTLSESSRHDLRSQLANAGVIAEVAKVRSWVAPGRTGCAGSAVGSTR
jgi:hypothetical protein